MLNLESDFYVAEETLIILSTLCLGNFRKLICIVDIVLRDVQATGFGYL